MACREKTHFTATSANWTEYQLDGTTLSFGATGCTMTPNNGGGFSKLGLYRAAPRKLTKGDIIYFFWTVGTQSNNHYDWVGIMATSDGGARPTFDTVSGGHSVSVYLYPDTGMKLHGFNLNTNHTISTVVANNDAIVYRITCDATTGFGTAVVRTSTGIPVYEALGEGSEDLTALSEDYYPIIMEGNNQGVDLVQGFIWADSAGPTPTAPSSPAAVALGLDAIDVSWSDNDIAYFETGFSVERSETSGSGFAEVDTVLQGTNTFSDTGLDPGTTYYYRIRSYWTFDGTTWYSAYTSEVSAETESDANPTSSTGNKMIAQGLM